MVKKLRTPRVPSKQGAQIAFEERYYVSVKQGHYQKLLEVYDKETGEMFDMLPSSYDKWYKSYEKSHNRQRTLNNLKNYRLKLEEQDLEYNRARLMGILRHGTNKQYLLDYLNRVVNKMTLDEMRQFWELMEYKYGVAKFFDYFYHEYVMSDDEVIEIPRSSYYGTPKFAQSKSEQMDLIYNGVIMGLHEVKGFDLEGKKYFARYVKNVEQTRLDNF